MLLKVESGIDTVIFQNWNNALGSALEEPVELAASDTGCPITILAEASKLSGVYRTTLQIMIEEDRHE